MIVIISAQQAQLDGPIDVRFGRCSWLLRIDTDTRQWQAFQNPGINQSGGAGVAAAQFAIDQHANAVISGDFGPNAANALRAAGVEMYRLVDGASTPQQALDLYTQGKLIAF
ncbi:MAG TPA: NifB/NifX family molybdenum-iron cluster-binding protein [Anaerolineaceae bacterium]|jgi:predicted Fe-Mo cluster-binding NifX family protein|nr:NifB/NifX family molybdenum-iron cluster-binding protein [Anaerolineaceae bacterium]